MATATSKEAPMEQANGTSSMTKAIETNVKEVQEATAKAGKAIEANVKGAQETAAKASKAIEANVKEAQEAATNAGNAIAVWLRKLPLASLGLAAVIVDETKVVVDKLFMNELVERGERVQKDAEQWMKNVQARFR